ncbi:MAG: radical SAM family heme chaperone HemW [Gemmataceae bacterium]
MTPGPPWLSPSAAYVHIPFCAHQCGYCDFAVVAGREADAELYLDALELELVGDPRPVETIFLGGGTPTQFTWQQLDRLLHALQNAHPWPPAGEASIEATPESVTPDKVAVLADRGITRVSLGVQSFRRETLAALDRRHRPDDIRPAIDCIRRRIDNLSLDLIFGVPGTNLADWAADVAAAIDFAPEHVSTYGLTYEKGTPLWRERHAGRVVALSEDDELAMYLHALDALNAAGYRQYEVSNHARPGRACRHNQTYWANHAHWAYGMGAARYVGGVRMRNTRRFDDYVRKTLSGESAVVLREELEPEERARETISTQLRRAEGIDRGVFHEQTGFDLDALAGDAIRRFVELGLLRDDGQSVAWTRAGVCVIDSIIAAMM